MNPITGVLIFTVGGMGALIGYMGTRAAIMAGKNLTVSDFRPLSPTEGPPLPRWTRTHPELLKELMEGGGDFPY